jgi:hypothetical protein
VDVPTLEKKLAACRKDVAYDREAIDFAESFLALAKRKQVVFVGGGGAFPPVLTTVPAAREAYILWYVTGRITKTELALSPRPRREGRGDAEEARRARPGGKGRA